MGDVMKDYNVGDLVSIFASNRLRMFLVWYQYIIYRCLTQLEKSYRMIPARGEMGAGHMADGYARGHNGLGVVFTSTGPGAANVAGAIVESRFEFICFALTGQTASENLDKNQGTVHDVPNQLGCLVQFLKRLLELMMKMRP